MPEDCKNDIHKANLQTKIFAEEFPEFPSKELRQLNLDSLNGKYTYKNKRE